MYAGYARVYTVRVPTLAIAGVMVTPTIGGPMFDIIRSCCLALAMLVWVARTESTETTHHIPDAAVVASVGQRRRRPSTKKDDSQLSPDPLNANRATERGQRALDRSLRE